ncbi:hypothetical protein BJX62DRAFT_92521 [Aspergillus germanicus]
MVGHVLRRCITAVKYNQPTNQPTLSSCSKVTYMARGLACAGKQTTLPQTRELVEVCGGGGCVKKQKGTKKRYMTREGFEPSPLSRHGNFTGKLWRSSLLNLNRAP